MQNKRAESLVMGSPTISFLLTLASSLQKSVELLLEKLNTLPEFDLHRNTLIKDPRYLGFIMGISIFLPFICELALTALYLLDNQEIKKIPKEHSLLFWWKGLNKDTKEKIINTFEQIKREQKAIQEIKEDVETLLKNNNKSHTEWRYLWRRGFATGGPSSIGFQTLTNVILYVGWAYPKDQRNRKVQDSVDGHKNFYEARKKRGMIKEDTQ